jgi:hypothetical protein
VRYHELFHSSAPPSAQLAPGAAPSQSAPTSSEAPAASPAKAQLLRASHPTSHPASHPASFRYYLHQFVEHCCRLSPWSLSFLHDAHCELEAEARREDAGRDEPGELTS